MPEEKTTDLTNVSEDVMTPQEFKSAADKGRGNIFIGTLNVALQPAKAITSRLRDHYETRYEGKYKRAKILFWVDMALLGLIIALSVFVTLIYFYKPSIADKIHIDTAVMPQEIVSGGEVSVVWVYRNDSESILDEAYWSFRLPNNFQLLDTIPAQTDATKNIVDIGTLPPGGEGRLRLHGRVWGTVGDSQTVWSTLGFTQAENGKNEQKPFTASYTIDDSVFWAELEAPEKLINNQDIDVKIKYKNTGSAALVNAEVHAYWPAGFEYLSSSLPMLENVFRIGDLEAGKEGEITIRGYLACPDSRANFYFETYVTAGEEKARQEILAASAQIVPPQIEAVIRINDTSEPVAGWGEKMDVVVSYKNIGDFALSDVALAVEADAYLINTARIEGMEFRDGRFYFKESAAGLAPGETKKVSGALYLKSNPDFSQLESQKNITMPVAVLASYRVEGEEGAAVYKTGRIDIKMITPFASQAFARYWAETGDQLGRGSMPPKVERPTKYWVFWNLPKTTSDLTNMFLQAKLAPNVTYAGLSSVTAGDSINYNPDTGMITWSLKELSATAESGAVIGLSFEVEIVPTADQAGTAASLVDWIKVTAHDEFIGKDLSFATPLITTELAHDTRAAGLGKVRP
ncbi:MAG: hypothetical protein PHW53_00325 [Patescibacteria group bacterium]|nr:hypothetical protein [Patescibacteria group bacterium]